MSEVAVQAESSHAAGAGLRITAIGTSNMLLRNGFRQPFENDARVKFKNLAIGSSGSVLLGMRLDQVRFDRTDVLILEFAVNEENFVKEKSSSHEAVTNAMRLAVDRACRAGCLPVLLLLPNLPFLKSAPVAETMKTVFQRAGLPIFDIAEAAQKSAELGQVPVGKLFRDPKHLKPSVARAFSVLMIETLRAMPLDRRAELRETGALYRPLSFVPATDVVGEDFPALFTRATRMVEATGALLKEGEEIAIPDLGGPASIVGVLANGARTRGVLEAADGQKIAFSVPDARWRDDPDAFVLIARPVPPVRIPRGGENFKVVSSTAEPAGPAQIELCGLFVRSDKEPSRMAITPMPGRWRNLNAHIDETALRMIAMLALSED